MIFILWFVIPTYNFNIFKLYWKKTLRFSRDCVWNSIFVSSLPLSLLKHSSWVTVNGGVYTVEHIFALSSSHESSTVSIFFSQVHTVNTHVFSIRARFHIHFKDISNTAKLYIHNICLWQEWYDMMDQKEMTYINVV